MPQGLEGVRGGSRGVLIGACPVTPRELNDDQRAELGEITGKCPVEKTITGELAVETILE